MDKGLRDYYEKFGEFPPLVQTMTYEDEIYQELMQKAIKKDKAIDIEDINFELKLDDTQFDIALGETDEEIYEKGLKHRLGED